MVFLSSSGISQALKHHHVFGFWRYKNQGSSYALNTFLRSYCHKTNMLTVLHLDALPPAYGYFVRKGTYGTKFLKSLSSINTK